MTSTILSAIGDLLIIAIAALGGFTFGNHFGYKKGYGRGYDHGKWDGRTRSHL